jgi:hypothetical protein
MIDYVIDFIFRLSKIDLKQSYGGFVDKKFIDNNSKVLKIIIPPRGKDRLFITDILMRRFSKKGYSCLAYFFEGELLSKDPQKTLEYFDTIRRKII